MDKNFRGNFARLRGGLRQTNIKTVIMKYLFYFLPLLLINCTKPDDISSPCISGDCDARLILNYPMDENGYYHVDLDFEGDYYPRFNIYVEADDMYEKYQYNKTTVIEARFDTDTYWTIDGDLNFTVPLYNPWLSLSQYNGTPIPIDSADVTLSFYDGLVMPVVQRDTRIYLSDNCFGECNTSNGKMYGKRIVGPISPQILNDTINIYSEILWEAGSNYRVKDDLIAKIIIQ
tara:strand:+ start:1610 stop:2305 length:696 start_codon:yes stop_codon:yes gene_type:complete